MNTVGGAIRPTAKGASNSALSMEDIHQSRSAENHGGDAKYASIYLEHSNDCQPTRAQSTGGFAIRKFHCLCSPSPTIRSVHYNTAYTHTSQESPYHPQA